MVNIPQPDTTIPAIGLDRIRLSKSEVEREHVMRIGTEVILLNADKTVDHQARSDQQHQRKRDLCRNENTTHILPPNAIGPTPSGFLERTDEICFRCLQCRDDSKEQCRKHYHEGRERENRSVQRQLTEPRKTRRSGCNKELQTYPRENNAENATCHRQRKAFGHELTHEPPTSGA